MEAYRSRVVIWMVWGVFTLGRICCVEMMFKSAYFRLHEDLRFSHGFLEYNQIIKLY